MSYTSDFNLWKLYSMHILVITVQNDKLFTIRVKYLNDIA